MKTYKMNVQKILLFFVMILGLETKATNLADSIGELKLNLNVPTRFVLADKTTVDTQEKKTKIFIGKIESEQIQIEQTSPYTKAQFDSFVKNKFSILNRLYSDTPTPYIGMISKKTKCPNELLPKKTISKNIFVFTAFSTDKFQLGSCQANQLTHQALIAAVLKNHSLIQITAYIKKQNSADFEALNQSVLKLERNEKK